MIHLDTSFLVRALLAHSPEESYLREWLGCMIAAIAVRSGAAMATSNPGDFRRFEVAGLKVLPL